MDNIQQVTCYEMISMHECTKFGLGVVFQRKRDVYAACIRIYTVCIPRIIQKRPKCGRTLSPKLKMSLINVNEETNNGCKAV